MFHNIKIVLCRPEGSLNIGSICRAMENMDFNRLAIVAPKESFNQDQIKQMSLHAFPLFEKAQFCDNLEQALSDSVLSIAMTRRVGKNRKESSLSPQQLIKTCAPLKDEKISLVFGNEKNGLNDEEVASCTLASHIPTSSKNPSLNLAQAVQISCYNFFMAQTEEQPLKESPILATQGDILDLRDLFNNFLEGVNFYDKADRFNTPLFIKDILSRSSLSLKEVEHIKKMIFKIMRITKK